MQASLPLLIDRARTSRDEQSLRARRATQALHQAQATLQQLEGFRADYLRRSPATSGQAIHTDGLQDWQRFVSRLDEAVALQRQEIEIRRHQDAEGQRLLLDAQRRLMAFEALAARQRAERERKAQRQAQHEADEFAARATRAQPNGSS